MRKSIFFSLILIAPSIYPIRSLSPLADPILYYKTFVGQDFDPIDGRYVLRYIPGSGGGVYDNGDDNGGAFFDAEIGLDLPQGPRLQT